MSDLQAWTTEMFMRTVDELNEAKAEIKRLKAELEVLRGDGYECAQGCAHCCSMHRCDCYN